jgi:hypothetical protein
MNGLTLSPVLGVQEIKAAIGKVQKGTGYAVQRGLNESGKFLLKESLKIVPLLTGALRSSGKVVNVGGRGMKADIVVCYGGKAGVTTIHGNDNVDYAVDVHQDRERLHGKAFNIAYAAKIANPQTPFERIYYKRRKDEEQFKFLEQPAREKKNEMLQIIVNEVKKG